MMITEKFYEHSSNERNKRDILKDRVNIHNRRIGKEAIQKIMKKKCRCMGLSGSCTLQEWDGKITSYTSKIDQKDLAISLLVRDFANIMLETTFVGDDICC